MIKVAVVVVAKTTRKPKTKLARNARQDTKICKVLKKESTHPSCVQSTSHRPFPSKSHLLLNRLSSVNSQTLRRQHNVKLELAGGGTAGALVLAGGRVVLDGVEVDYEVVLDGEDGVGGEPGVVFGVDLGDDGLVVFVGDLFEVFISSLLEGDGSCSCWGYWLTMR